MPFAETLQKCFLKASSDIKNSRLYLSYRPTNALDLPLTLLVWEDKQGQVYLSYRQPNALQQDFKLSEQQAVLDKMEKMSLRS